MIKGRGFENVGIISKIKSVAFTFAEKDVDGKYMYFLEVKKGFVASGWMVLVAWAVQEFLLQVSLCKE